MKGQNLSLKNATKLLKPHQNATKNPFIINHWFDILEETIENLGLKERPDLIWNVDELGKNEISFIHGYTQMRKDE